MVGVPARNCAFPQRSFSALRLPGERRLVAVSALRGGLRPGGAPHPAHRGDCGHCPRRAPDEELGVRLPCLRSGGQKFPADLRRDRRLGAGDRNQRQHGPNQCREDQNEPRNLSFRGVHIQQVPVSAAKVPKTRSNRCDLSTGGASRPLLAPALLLEALRRRGWAHGPPGVAASLPIGIQPAIAPSNAGALDPRKNRAGACHPIGRVYLVGLVGAKGFDGWSKALAACRGRSPPR